MKGDLDKGLKDSPVSPAGRGYVHGDFGHRRGNGRGFMCPGAAVPGGRVSFGGGQNRGEQHHQWNDGSAQHPS